MLRIWGRVNSSNVQKVLWCCAELGLSYERIEAGGEHGVTRSAEYLAMNPNALVPTIDDGGFILWESNVIVRYLANKHGLGTLCPTDLRVRFEAERWMDWQATTLAPSHRTIFMGLVRTPPEKRDNGAIESALKEASELLKIFDARLGKTPFAAGADLTMGDIPLEIVLHRLFTLGVARSGVPNVSRWYDRLTERPGYKAHVMLPLS